MNRKRSKQLRDVAEQVCRRAMAEEGIDPEADIPRQLFRRVLREVKRGHIRNAPSAQFEGLTVKGSRNEPDRAY